MTTLMTDLQAVQQQRQAKNADTFHRLAQQVADGASLDPEAVISQLDSLDRTAAELDAAAGLILARRQWAAQAARESTLMAEHNRLYREQEAETATHAETIKAANATHAVKMADFQRKIAAIATERDRAQTARNRLLTSGPDAGRLSELWAEKGTLTVRIQQLEAEQRPHVALLDRIRREAGKVFPPIDDTAAQNAALNDSRIRAEITRLESRLDQVAAELAQIEREALLP